MVHIATAASLSPAHELLPFSGQLDSNNQSVLVVRDDAMEGALLPMICDFLDLRVEHIGGDEDLNPILRINPPLAVVATLDGTSQDGCHILKVVAGIDRDLPVLILTDGNPAFLGAVDAVIEAWGLTRVVTVAAPAEIGTLVDFLCHAARDAGLSRMVRV